MRAWIVLSLLASQIFGQVAAPSRPSTNKRLAMYRVFYLPFDLTFQPGRDLDSILPYRGNRMLEAHELVSVDSNLKALRDGLKRASLLEASKVVTGQTRRLAVGLYSHRETVNRSAVDGLSTKEREEIGKALREKDKEVAQAFFQLRLLKRFIEPIEEGVFHFFIVSASWCESSLEYRLLLESYFKRFSPKEAVLHSLLVEDAQKQIFRSPLMKELFPHPKEYSHETVPRFIAVEWKSGEPHIWEEGDALAELYDRHLAAHRGFLENPSTPKEKK